MFMNILVILLVLSIGYAWLVRGVFSAMLQSLCALVAGAVAFAAWEPLAVMLVNFSPERGFFSFLESIAWGVALIVPFAVTFLLLRVLSDKVVPNNIKNNSSIDYAGGAIFGLATGVISVGVLVIGVGNMRVATDFMGYQPLWYSSDRATGAGSLVQSDRLWLPADKIVAALYGKLSEGTMSSAQPLAYWYPEIELAGFASRISPGDGAARNAVRPKDFRVLGAYTVGPESGTPVAELLKTETGTQTYVDINNKPVSSGRLHGYIIEFEPGAKERGERGAGALVVSNGQVRMLAEDGDGNTRTIFPAAVISESREPEQYGRWRFDAQDVFITSTGGKSKIPMGFEFVVPQGFTPMALFVKNIRVKADEIPDPVAFENISRRDLQVRTGSILEGQRPRSVIYREQNAVDVDTSTPIAQIETSTRVMEVMSSTAAKREMTVSDTNEIVGGEGTFDAKIEVGRRNAPTSRNLRVERYAVGTGQALIKLDVSAGSPFGFLTGAARNAPLDESITLIDRNGNAYEAIGFEYIDRDLMRLRYTRGSTLSGVSDTPTLSTTRDDQRLRIMFIVTRGVEIERFAIGDVVIARFNPPIVGN